MAQHLNLVEFMDKNLASSKQVVDQNLSGEEVHAASYGDLCLHVAAEGELTPLHLPLAYSPSAAH